MKLPPHSLGRRVVLVTFATLGFSFLSVAAGLVFFEYRAARLRLQENLAALAQINFINVAPAVEFNFAETAREALGRLESVPFVVAATVYAAGGREPFARYERSGVPARFPVRTRPDGFEMNGGRALLTATFARDGQAVATLQLEGNLANAWQGLWRTLRLLGVLLIVLLAGGVVLARWVRRTIADPVLHLARTAEAVKTSRDFSARAAVETSDEVGQLAVQFNAMLDGLAARDREIAASHAMQQAVLAGAGVAVISCGLDGTVRLFNPEAERLLGYAAAEIVGLATPLLWHETAEIAARGEALSARLGRPITGFGVFVAGLAPGQSTREEWTYVRKDGGRVQVYLVVSALCDERGETLGYVGLATDLTERKRRESALHAFTEITSVVTGREFFAAATHHLVQDLGVRGALIAELVEEAGEPCLRTLAAWSGGARPTFIAPVADLPWAEVVALRACHHADCLGERYPRLASLAGFPVRSCVGSAIQEPDGRVIGVVGVFDDKPMPDAETAQLLLVLTAARAATELQRLRHEDLTARANAELELRVRERTAELHRRVAEVELLNGELEAFSYSVSHDLRAPVRNITGFLELFGRRAGNNLDEESRRFIQTAVAEAGRMSRLIEDLLEFSRIATWALRRELVPLDVVVTGVRNSLAADCAGRRIEWRVGPLPTVQGDRTLLHQVFENLIANAVKFTRRREVARIEIGLLPPEQAPDGRPVIFVRDNGAGFNPKHSGKLFGVFQRLHNQRDFEGTGIGLANVKRIVQRHGGRVWAEGEVEQGATFYFSLAEPVA